jgi:hypothetical protein
MGRIISETWADSPDDPIYNEPSPIYSMGSHLWTKRLHDATASNSTEASTTESDEASKGSETDKSGKRETPEE